MNKKTILIVDDTATNRIILKHILTTHNYDTLEAENGMVALDMLRSGKYTVSLILLDITMPIMNGYEFLDVIHKDTILSSIPVIVATGSESSNAEVLSLEKGATDFITKPYNQEIVFHRIESILRLVENTALVSQLEIDQLTGAYNRESFYRHAEVYLDTHPDMDFDIVYSNIENFKLINTKYGTEIGDELLKYIAEHNKEYVNGEGVCGRIGADSFVFLHPHADYGTQEKIGKQINEDFLNAPVKKFVIQYGIYHIHNKQIPVSDMCDRAMMALASIKRQYGMYYGIYDDAMRNKVLREHQLTDYMEQALKEKQFAVFLQPKHSVQTGEIAGAEALVRWIHPELGFISPGEFIPIFEKNGFITKLDRYMWEEVCIILKHWKDNGTELVPVSVNASRADFTIDNLPKIIVDLVDSYGIPHDILHFEVTESAYTDDPKQIISVVRILRSMGFLIEMDDFGSGYSSLNMLSELPIDILKLDMRFMQNGNDSDGENKRSILSFTVSLSKWMQLPTVAEGVETEEEVELLRTMGCNFIQGYYFAKPMPVSEFEVYMENNRSKHREISVSTGSDSAEQSSSDITSTVLIVEDIESNREILVSVLKSSYRVVTAKNGQEALDILESHAEEFSCMLLDLLMPVMDGFQLLEHIRNDGILQKIPVIITSEAGADSELRALRLGAYSFVAKPYSEEILLHHVCRAIHEHDYRKFSEKS